MPGSTTSGACKFLSATDEEALAAFQLCCRLEGIIPALEPAHALAKVIELAPKKPKDHLMVVNLSGRGDKDLDSVARQLGGHSEVGAVAWWKVISRQKIVGWMLIAVSALYLVYFLKTRLFAPGPTSRTRNGCGSSVRLSASMLGTINIRMAAMRERNRRSACRD